MLKPGEIKAIQENIRIDKEGNVRIVNNAIFLCKTEDVILRTNGSVCYGLYRKSANECIEFTYKSSYAEPYIGKGKRYLGEKKTEYFTLNYRSEEHTTELQSNSEN